MSRPKGSKNKPKQVTEAPIAIIEAVEEKVKEKKTRASKTDGFTHGPCGEFWPATSPSCPYCNPTN